VAKAIITPDQDAVISEVEIAAPLDRVFQGGPAELPTARKDYSGGWPGVLQQVKQCVERTKL
jgi:hypothetical protein